MNLTAIEKYVLYADDDADDQEMMMEVLSEVAPDVKLITADNGNDLIEFLNNVPAESILPSLIVIDMNMPGWDGIRTLKELKADERVKDIPVVMFSTSVKEADRQHALSLGAVAFVSKPSSYRELEPIIKSFIEYFK